MINCLQTQQNTSSPVLIITKDIKDDLFHSFIDGKSIDDIKTIIISIAENYKINYNSIIKLFLNDIVRRKKEVVTESFLRMVENLMHMKDGNSDYNINYLISCLKELVEAHNNHSDEQ